MMREVLCVGFCFTNVPKFPCHCCCKFWTFFLIFFNLFFSLSSSLVVVFCFSRQILSFFGPKQLGFFFVFFLEPISLILVFLGKTRHITKLGKRNKKKPPHFLRIHI